MRVGTKFSTNLRRTTFPALKSDLCAKLIDVKKKQTKKFQVLEGDDTSKKARDSIKRKAWGNSRCAALYSVHIFEAPVKDQ